MLFLPVAVCVIVSALFAAAGLFLAGVGVRLVHADVAVAAGVFSAAVAALTLYGVYLLGRAAWRTDREKPSRRADLRSILICGLEEFERPKRRQKASVG